MRVEGRWTVDDSWANWPMWACHRGPKPLGYVKADTLAGATEKARRRFGEGVELYPWDGVL